MSHTLFECTVAFPVEGCFSSTVVEYSPAIESYFAGCDFWSFYCDIEGAIPASIHIVEFLCKEFSS